MNVLTAWLADRYPEAGPMEFYRDLFPKGSLASDKRTKGDYAGVIVRCVRQPDGSEKAERHFVFDELANIRNTVTLDAAVGGVTDLLSPVSYAGRRPMLNRAHELFALSFDLDGVSVENGSPVGLVDLFYQMEDLPERGALVPTPTYTVSSGTGLHLYYMLDEPIRMWPNVCEALAAFRDALTKRLWNKYVTDLSDEPQLEGVVQAFRMVGSLSKSGDQVIRAFRTGGRVSMEYLNGFVPDGARVDPALWHASHTMEEARALWPEWDPDWRRKAARAPSCPWRVKRDLYDWWRRRVESGEPFEGNRYWCLFVAACYASKCPDVSYEELEEWAHSVRPRLDRLTRRPGNEFTAEDVEAAISVYGNPISVKLRRDKVSQKTQLPMPVNKRNGRKQSQHMAVMRAVQSVTDPEMKWRNKNGRPKGSGTKAEAIRSYAAAHPDASHSEIAHELGVSRPTVIKWLKPGWREEWEAARAPRHAPGELYREGGHMKVGLHRALDPEFMKDDGTLKRP